MDLALVAALVLTPSAVVLSGGIVIAIIRHRSAHSRRVHEARAEQRGIWDPTPR